MLFIPLLYWFVKSDKKEITVYTSIIFIFVPFLGYLLLPVTVNPWHLGGEMAVSLILVAYLLKKILEKGLLGKIIFIVIFVAIIWSGGLNFYRFLVSISSDISLDPSLYKNEIAVIDYIYQKAKGQNFKVYTFMPSVYDYPYQYLFWWYGQKEYGYIPVEYAYAPNKPPYISNKEKFNGSKDNYKGLVFLIKEPNRGYNWKSGWEATYRSMELLSVEKLGLIEVEMRKEF